MDRLVTRIGNEPAVPTELDMDFAFDLDKRTFDGLQRIFNQLCDLTDILGDDYDLDRLKELVQADREGRCVVMPVKPGAHVYVIRNILTENGIKKFVAKMEVKEFIVNSLGNCYYVSYDDDHRVYHFNLCEFGKTVFLTSEEAALEKMKDEDK